MLRCAEWLNDPWAWYGLDDEQRTDILAMHRELTRPNG